MKPSSLPVCIAYAVLITSSIAPAATPAAKIDLTDVRNSLAAYSLALDTFINTAPNIKTAEGAAKAVNSMAAANTDMATVFKAFPAQHPEVVKLQNAPEFAALFGQLAQMRTKFALMSSIMRNMRQQFGNDPQFALAVVAVEKSADLLAHCQPSQGLQLAGNIFREVAAVDTAIDIWALEHNKKVGDLVTATDIATSLKPGSRLRESAEHGLIHDSLGNPITINPLGTRPSVSQQTIASLSNVASLDFWKPYTAATTTLSGR